MADFTGGAADDVFNATSTTATTVNSGDAINGGAGKDTLNITSTATTNNSLAGLTATSIETVNITGANNLGAVTTATASPTAGAAQVRVLDITGARFTGEVQSVDFAGVTIATAGNVTIAGTTVALAAGDGAAAIATKVAAKLALLTTEIASVTQTGSKLTVTYLAADATTGVDLADPSATRLTVATDANTSPVGLAAGSVSLATVNATLTTVTSFSASNSVTVTVNGNDYVVDVPDVADLNVPAVAAPAAPTVVTTQGAAAVAETNVVTFGALAIGQSVTVNGLTLTATGVVAAADVAAFFAAGTVPATGTSSGANDVAFTKAATAGATTSVTYTSATAGNVTNVAISVGAVGGATAPTAPTFVEVAAKAAVTESSVVTFGGLSKGQSVTVGDQTVTATATMTADEVTAAMLAKTVTGFTDAAVADSTTSLKYTTSGAAGTNVADIVVSSAGNTATTARAVAVTNTVTAVTAQLNKVLAGAVTVGAGDEAGEIKLTSNSVGTALPTVSVSQGTTSRSSVDAADGATVAAAVRTQVAAGKQIQSITVTEAGAATFELFVNGASQGVSASATGATAVATALAASINIALGVSAANIAAGTTPIAVANGGVVTVTAPVAGTALPVLGVAYTGAGSLAFAQVASNVQAVASVTTTGDAAVSAASFADATEINLVGASGSATVSGMVAGQTIGFTDVTMANTVAFGALTSGSIAVSGSAGTLATTGNAITTLAITGTGTTGLTITDGGTVAATAADPITTLNLGTSGATTLNTVAMTSLATLSQSGAGAVTLTAGTKLASVNTGAGADLIKLVTTTAIDNPGTTIVETVNASLVSGAGADRLVIETTGTGNTTVDAGADNDTIFVNTLGSGTNSISGGDGNDAIRISAGSGLISGLQAVKIDGGAGTDVLRIANTGFTASDYTVLGANVSSVETLQLSATVAAGATALDASKIAMTRIEFLATGTNVVNEVSSTQTVALVRTPITTAVTGFISGVTAAIQPGAITVSSKGYIADQDTVTAGKQGTVFGDNLNLTLTNTATATAVAASGDKLTMSVAALGNSGTIAAPVAGAAPLATVNGDLRSLDVTLTSARGSGTNGAGSENMAGLTVGTLSNTAGALNLESLSSIKVAGSGQVIINAGSTHTALTGKLTSIDLSGMTALLDQNDQGQEIGTVGGIANTIGGYNNLSTSLVTLNANIAETLTLGGARDTVVTNSTIAARDVITGFQVVASAADPLVADATRSDVLDLGTLGGTAFSASNAAKMTVTGSTLEAAVLQASALKAADGTTNVQNVVFAFGGNTYVYSDQGTEGLTDNDFLVQLSGSVNLDLLLTSGVIIA